MHRADKSAKRSQRVKKLAYGFVKFRASTADGFAPMTRIVVIFAIVPV